MSFLVYLLIVSFCICLFYGFYNVCLSRETFFKLNRFYLLCSLALAFLLPMVVIPQSFTVGLSSVAGQVNILPAMPFNWQQALWLLYVAGTTVSTSFLLFKLYRLRRQFQHPGPRAFSFFRWKAINPKLTNYQVVNAHEQAHIDGWHSLDVLLAELAAVFLWFNPVIYLYKISLRRLHEYMADQAAIVHCGDTRAYARLLLNGALGLPPALSNGFTEKALLKQRIYMLQRQASQRLVCLRYLLIVPVILLCCAFSVLSQAMANNGGITNFTQYLRQAIGHSAVFTHQPGAPPVTVSFIVNTSGKVTDVKALTGPNKALNTEAVRIVQGSPGWTPGQQNGQPVSVAYKIKLAYK